MIERSTNFTGEKESEVHNREIGAIVDELNNNSATLSQVQVAVKKVVQKTISVSSTDYFFYSGGPVNPSNDATVQITHGLSYAPLTFGYVTMGGTTYNLPYVEFNASGGTVKGVINLTTGYPYVTIQADYITTVTPPAFTAYVYVAATPALTS